MNGLTYYFVGEIMKNAANPWWTLICSALKHRRLAQWSTTQIHSMHVLYDSDIFSNIWVIFKVHLSVSWRFGSYLDKDPRHSTLDSMGQHTAILRKKTTIAPYPCRWLRSFTFFHGKKELFRHKIIRRFLVDYDLLSVLSIPSYHLRNVSMAQ